MEVLGDAFGTALLISLVVIGLFRSFTRVLASWKMVKWHHSLRVPTTPVQLWSSEKTKSGNYPALEHGSMLEQRLANIANPSDGYSRGTNSLMMEVHNISHCTLKSRRLEVLKRAQQPPCATGFRSLA